MWFLVGSPGGFLFLCPFCREGSGGENGETHIIDMQAKLYGGGFTSYTEHIFSSVVEYTAVKRIDAEQRYKQHLMEIEEMYRWRLIR